MLIEIPFLLAGLLFRKLLVVLDTMACKLDEMEKDEDEGKCSRMEMEMRERKRM